MAMRTALEARFRSLFEKQRETGLGPNEAAAAALLQIGDGRGADEAAAAEPPAWLAGVEELYGIVKRNESIMKLRGPLGRFGWRCGPTMGGTYFDAEQPASWPSYYSLVGRDYSACQDVARSHHQLASYLEACIAVARDGVDTVELRSDRLLALERVKAARRAAAEARRAVDRWLAARLGGPAARLVDAFLWYRPPKPAVDADDARVPGLWYEGDLARVTWDGKDYVVKVLESGRRRVKVDFVGDRAALDTFAPKDLEPHDLVERDRLRARLRPPEPTPPAPKRKPPKAPKREPKASKAAGSKRKAPAAPRTAKKKRKTAATPRRVKSEATPVKTEKKRKGRPPRPPPPPPPEQCPICFDLLPREDLLDFSCGHKICRECGKRLADMQRGAHGATRNRMTIRSCALCRQTVSATVAVKVEPS